MRRPDVARAVLWAFRFFERAPDWLSRGVVRVAADVAWLHHGGGVRQLEANLRRARPDATSRQLRRLSRAGMRTYLRYFVEAFALPRLTPEQRDARVRVIGAEVPSAAGSRPMVLALAHQGNWDLAGAWATAHIAPATTVAERLEPPEVYEAFTRMREAVGMRVIPLDNGQDVFRDLVRAAAQGKVLIPLVADRDLTSRGIEVDLMGARARVAAGPAALAVATGAILVPTLLRQERLRGARRRAAGTPWGLVVTFCPPVPVPEGTTRTEAVRAMTQAWIDTLGEDIARYPTHWHMLQKVFVADLDPGRQAAKPAEEHAVSRPAVDAGTAGEQP